MNTIWEFPHKEDSKKILIIFNRMIYDKWTQFKDFQNPRKEDLEDPHRKGSSFTFLN